MIHFIYLSCVFWMVSWNSLQEFANLGRISERTRLILGVKRTWIGRHKIIWNICSCQRCFLRNNFNKLLHKCTFILNLPMVRIVVIIIWVQIDIDTYNLKLHFQFLWNFIANNRYSSVLSFQLECVFITKESEQNTFQLKSI